MTASISKSELFVVLRRMPKAELHIHIEGSLEPELIFELARKNGIALPYENVEALRAAYSFTDLQSFLDLYYAGASVLCTEEDFYAMAMAYFRRAVADNVVHTELFFDPQTHTERGVAMSDVILGLSRACSDAAQQWGLSAKLILCFLRHLPEASAIDTLKAALPFRQHFIGVGLDSSEKGNPPEKFSNVFSQCRDLGLHVVAHAGEEGPAGYILSALDVLQVERVDHGVRCTEDAELVRRLANTRIPLTVCPLSNVKLRVFDNMQDHNLVSLLRAGLCVTVNSDDPAYFGGYLNQNFEALFESLPALTCRDAWQLASNSIEASFVPAEQKRVWAAQLDEVFSGVI